MQYIKLKKDSVTRRRRSVYFFAMDIKIIDKRKYGSRKVGGTNLCISKWKR